MIKRTNLLCLSEFQRRKNVIYRRFENKFQTSNFYKVNKNGMKKDCSDVTTKIMKNGVPIIANGVLRIDDNMFGCVDMIVRSDYINHIFNKQMLTEEQIQIKAPLCKQYHYCIVILQAGPQGYHENKLKVYNDALGTIQGYVPNQAYILDHYADFLIEN